MSATATTTTTTTTTTTAVDADTVEIIICKSKGGFGCAGVSKFGQEKMVQLGYTFAHNGSRSVLQLRGQGLVSAVWGRDESESESEAELETESDLLALLHDYCHIRTNPDLIYLVKTYPDQQIFNCTVAIESLPRKAFELGFFQINGGSSFETLHFEQDNYHLYCTLENVIDDVRNVPSDNLISPLDRLRHIDDLMNSMAHLLSNASSVQ